MHQQMILQIQSLTRKLSKRQAEFNTLNRKIETLQQSIHLLKEEQEKLYQRVREEMIPLQRRIAKDRTTMVVRLDQLHDRYDFTSKEQRKLRHLIHTNALDLMKHYGVNELVSIVDKYKPMSFVEEVDSGTQHQKVQSVNTEQGTEEEYTASYEEWEFDKEQFTKDKEAKRKGKVNPIKEQQRYKSVRSLYLDLVKALHPDKEPDDTERVRKTALMHRVTEAYRQNDLQLLLYLQMELHHINQKQLDSLSDELLAYYNSFLSAQLVELEQQYTSILDEINQIIAIPVEKTASIEQVKIQFNADLKSLKRTAKNIKSELPLWSDAEIVKSILKNYHYE